MTIQETLNNIEYVLWHDIRVVDEGLDNKVTMVLPAREDLLNYVGTGHAGAIYTLAETAAGVTADGIAQSMDGFILLRGAEVRYTKRAVGELTATGEVDAGLADQTRKLFTESARADMAVLVDITDSEKNSVFQGTFNYALRPRN